MAERMSQHLNPDEIEQWAEGLLPTTRAFHLTDCATCLATAERERQFFLKLAQLERFAPTADFAERVMANVRIPTPSGRFEKS
jgi:hypothetical protein